MRPLQEQAEQAAEESREIVRHYPLPSVATAFGVGLATGLVTVLLLSDSSRSREDAIADRVVRGMSHMIPDALSKRMS